MSVVAVIAGAGSGTRFGSTGPKALVKLGGEALVVHAVRSMWQSGVVDHCVVTAPANALGAFRECLDAAGLQADVVAGGSTRQASVAAGLEAGRAAIGSGGSEDLVLIHDAARALTPPAHIRRVVEALRAGHRAVVPALKVIDTIKQVGPALHDGAEPVEATLDRSQLRAMQTPQGFTMETIMRAHELYAERATTEATSAPDDAYLAELIGEQVVLVEGSQEALKITQPLDLAIAELFLAQQRTKEA